MTTAATGFGVSVRGVLDAKTIRPERVDAMAEHLADAFGFGYPIASTMRARMADVIARDFEAFAAPRGAEVVPVFARVRQ